MNFSRNKYRNKPTTVDGIRFASQKEASRYGVLKLRERANDIANLRLQVKYPLIVKERPVCTYVADFVYTDLVTGNEVVEDVKGMRTPVYNLKKKLMKAVYGIEIVEVGMRAKRTRRKAKKAGVPDERAAGVEAR